jgi:GR25 family glycosyltransferase involved in LPS biosynthesis
MRPMETQAAIAGIPVYVISLKDSETRRRDMTERLGRLGIPFRFVDAVDGRWRALSNKIDGARLVREGFHSESALASAASHRLAHRMVATGNSDLALIFEDDAVPLDHLPKALNTATKLRFDVLKLEGAPWGRRVSIGNVDGYSVFVGTPSLGGAAYLIHRNAADRFCRLPVIDMPLDLAFGDPRLRLRVLELQPYPVIQDKSMPSLLDFQPYQQRLTNRPGFFQKLASSVKKRAMLVRLYGLRVALAIELQKHRQASTVDPARFRGTP